MIRPKDEVTQEEIDLISSFIATMFEFTVERAPQSWGVDERLTVKFREIIHAELDSLPPLILNIGEPLNNLRGQLFAIVDDLAREADRFPGEELERIGRDDVEWNEATANWALDYIGWVSKFRFASLVLGFVQLL